MNVRHRREVHEFEGPMTVKQLLERLDIVPEGVVVTVNGSLVTRDHRIGADDEVEIIRAISGGGPVGPEAGSRGPSGSRCGTDRSTSFSESGQRRR